MLEFIYFLSAAVIAYTYFGYPLLLFVFQFIAYSPVKKGDKTPFVTVFISAYNEASYIETKVLNLLESDYPKDRMEIMVGSDGSTDETYQIIKRLAAEKNIRYTVSFARMGKPAMINKMSKDAKGDIYVFSDARQKFERSAIRQLVRPFEDESVGCVSGELMIAGKPQGSGSGLGLYWNYEKSLRRMESNIGSMLGATGAIYAVRKEYFHYLPDVILDDVYAPMCSVMMGKRAVFEPSARAYDDVSESTEKEFSRKVRTLAGNFQLFSMMPEYFLPNKSRVAFQMFSHKALRLFAPYFLILLFLSNIFLAGQSPFFMVSLILQILFYTAALIGHVAESRGNSFSGFWRLFSVPYEFCALNAAAIVAFYKFLSGNISVFWDK
ncbi:MAG: glycosyltransferase family 2 protein [Candidatus Omnitrophota bacterium]